MINHIYSWGGVDMAYWWVNQGKTFSTAFRDGYLWAPNPSVGGFPHWRNMLRLEVGDIVFCYSDKRMRAVCTIQAAPAPLMSPYPDDWKQQEPGTIALASFVALPAPISYPHIVGAPNNISLAGAYPKLQLADKPALGYLYELTVSAGQQLLSVCNVALPPAANSKAPPATGPATTKRYLALARIGQGLFGKDVREDFRSTCAVTGLQGTGMMLQAAHIKPWELSDNSERLDPQNGLLLHATLHHAFDQGHFSFDNSGMIMIKQSFSASAAILRLDQSRKLPAQTLTPRRLAYLAGHRKKHGF